MARTGPRQRTLRRSVVHPEPRPDPLLGGPSQPGLHLAQRLRTLPPRARADQPTADRRCCRRRPPRPTRGHRGSSGWPSPRSRCGGRGRGCRSRRPWSSGRRTGRGTRAPRRSGRRAGHRTRCRAGHPPRRGGRRRPPGSAPSRACGGRSGGRRRAGRALARSLRRSALRPGCPVAEYPRAVSSHPPRLRFAPSPTGYLHVGNARAALFNWLEARRTGGEMLLRVEDTDRERSSSELVENILASLRWLGLDWDGDIVFQADNLDVHREAALSLLAKGQAYWCDCTSEQVQARAKERGGPPGYDGFCRDRGARAERCHGAAVPGPRRRHDELHRHGAGRGQLREQVDRGLRAPALHGHADVPALERLRRRRDGHHPRRAGRGPRPGHPEVPAAARRPRPRSSRGVRAPADARQRGPPEALQAQGRRVRRRLRRPGLPARGDGELPRPPRLGARRTASRSAR